MDERREIRITFTVTPDGIYPNASGEEGDFVCGVVERDIDHAWASIAEFVRNLAVRSIEEVDDDPTCTNCGYCRSEHSMGGCDHFTTHKGGSVVYTSSDLYEMGYDDLIGWAGDENDYDDEVVEPIVAEMMVLGFGD